MTVQELKSILKENPDKQMMLSLSVNRLSVPAHFHVTEVGRLTKKFVDCGGVKRQSESCLLQIWVADDIDHRINTTKLAKIMDFASDILADDLIVEIEYGEVASRYKFGLSQATKTLLLFSLDPIKTECLAPEKCGVGKCC